MSKITALRHHDFCAGHRVVGHENKCKHLHGHNYRVYFYVMPNDESSLDKLGRVVDFSVIKDTLCEWIEKYWDHKMLLWEEDPVYKRLYEVKSIPLEGLMPVPFNPTAENMAQYLVEHIGPRMLAGTGCKLIRVRLEETRKCSVEYEL